MLYEHACNEFDGLIIDASHPEFGMCLCFNDPGAKKFQEMHNIYRREIERLSEIIDGTETEQPT
jgi:hypothetical protein